MLNYKQFNVEKLSGEAQALVHRMLDQRATPPSIARAVREQTGEHIHRASIGRYAARYRAGQQQRKEARQRNSALVERVRERGCQISEMLRAAFQETYAEGALNGSLLRISPLQWEAAERKRQELALKERQLLLAERRAEVFEQRLELDREKAQAALEKLEQKAQAGESLTADDVRLLWQTAPPRMPLPSPRTSTA